MHCRHTHTRERAFARGYYNENVVEIVHERASRENTEKKKTLIIIIIILFRRFYRDFLLENTTQALFERVILTEIYIYINKKKETNILSIKFAKKNHNINTYTIHAPKFVSSINSLCPIQFNSIVMSLWNLTLRNA